MFKRFFEGWVQPSRPMPPSDTVDASSNQDEDKNQKAFNAQQRRVVMMIFFNHLVCGFFCFVNQKRRTHDGKTKSSVKRAGFFIAD